MIKKKGIDEYVEMIDKGSEAPSVPLDEQAVRVADAYMEHLGLEKGLERVVVFVQDSITTRRAGSPNVVNDLSKVVRCEQARRTPLPSRGGASSILAFSRLASIFHQPPTRVPVETRQ